MTYKANCQTWANENIIDSNIDYERYDGLGLAGLVKDGSVSADELLEAAIERVEQRNPTIKAVVDRIYDQAKAAIAAGLPSGPFSGRALPAQGYRAVLCRHNHHLRLQRFSQVHCHWHETKVNKQS
jgi:hypothetical protein